MPTSTPPSPSSRRRSTHTTLILTTTTPTHSRRASQASSTTHRRTTSRSSFTLSDSGTLPPRTPETPTTHGADLTSSQQFHNSLGGGDGLDSLEDELAGAWDDDDGNESILSGGSRMGTATPALGSPASARRGNRISGTSATWSPTSSFANDPAGENVRPSPGRRPSCNNTPVKARRHTRTRSHYDGSEFGPELVEEHAGRRGQEHEAWDADNFTPEMRSVMRGIETLARHPLQQPSVNGYHIDTSTTTSSKSDPTANLLTHLRTLPSLSTLETLTTRLITAHTSLASHIAYQTRTVHTLTHPLFSPLCPPPDPETIDALLPLLDDTLVALPQPSHTSLNSLAHLERVTEEAGLALAGLSDSLHMGRQVEAEAARRLRVCTERVGEWRREGERGESAMVYVNDGDWQGRLARREAAGVCREVCDGFEKEIERWRSRLWGVNGAGESVVAGALDVGVSA